jgi:DNA-binding CsgD family transcriptional regulator
VTVHDTAPVSRLADLFGVAAFDAGGWMPALQALASATGSGWAQLIGLGGPSVVPFNFAALPREAEFELLAINGYARTVNSRVAAAERVGVMRVAWERDYDLLRPGLHSSDYDDFLRKWGMPHGCQITLMLGPDELVGMALHRSEQDGRTDPETRNLFAQVAPHVQAAVRTQRALGGQGAQLMANGLEAAETAAFVCDAKGAVQAMTSRAEQLVLAGDVLSLSARRLQARAPDDDARLKAALGHMLQLVPGEPALRQETMVLGSRGRRLVLQINALPTLDWNFAFTPRVLVVARSASVRRPDAAVLRAAFGLTPSEAAIALALAAGGTREAIAEARGASVGTVRQQVKTIFAKVGVSREPELILAVQGLG